MKPNEPLGDKNPTDQQQKGNPNPNQPGKQQERKPNEPGQTPPQGQPKPGQDPQKDWKSGQFGRQGETRRPIDERKPA